MSDRNKNHKDENVKEERLFRALSGVDEELLLRSEQGGKKNAQKVHKFPMYYASRIAAACLCFAVAGVLYVAMQSTKMADSTGSADTAAPQQAYSMMAEQENAEEALAAARSEDTAAGAESAIQSAAEMAEAEEAMPEGETAKESVDAAGLANDTLADCGQQAASQESASSVSGNEAVQDSTEVAPEDDEIFKKQGRQLPEKMTGKGQTK